MTYFTFRIFEKSTIYMCFKRLYDFNIIRKTLFKNSVNLTEYKKLGQARLTHDQGFCGCICIERWKHHKFFFVFAVFKTG